MKTLPILVVAVVLLSTPRAHADADAFTLAMRADAPALTASVAAGEDAVPGSYPWKVWMERRYLSAKRWRNVGVGLFMGLTPVAVATLVGGAHLLRHGNDMGAGLWGMCLTAIGVGSLVGSVFGVGLWIAGEAQMIRLKHSVPWVSAAVGPNKGLVSARWQF